MNIVYYDPWFSCIHRQGHSLYFPLQNEPPPSACCTCCSPLDSYRPGPSPHLPARAALLWKLNKRFPRHPPWAVYSNVTYLWGLPLPNTIAPSPFSIFLPLLLLNTHHYLTYWIFYLFIYLPTSSIFAWPSPVSPLSPPFPSLTRTRVIGFRAHQDHPEWSSLKDPFSK